MVWNIGLVNEYEAQSAIIPCVGIIIQNKYVMQQQCHFIFITQCVVTPKESSL
jgi:hypothetical protein